MKTQELALWIAKIVLFVFILLSPMISLHKHFSFLNHYVTKIVMLAVICALCFVDFQLALIATVAFLILVINLNNNISTIMNHKDKFEQQPEQQPAYNVQFGPLVQDPLVNNTANVVCQNQQVRNDINNDIISHYIDDKIKPYDVFIRMMTNEESLQKAQGEIL